MFSLQWTLSIMTVHAQIPFSSDSELIISKRRLTTWRRVKLKLSYYMMFIFDALSTNDGTY